MFNVPNTICYFRIFLAFYAFYQFSVTENQVSFLILTIVVIGLDGLDGIVARKLNQCTEFGAKLDILADRVIELAYWLFFAMMNLLPYWVFGFFLLRGIIVDWLSMKQVKPLGDSWLRSSRIMRACYGSLKLASFTLLIMLPAANLTIIIVYLTVFVCGLRAVPVLLSNND